MNWISAFLDSCLRRNDRVIIKWQSYCY